MRLPSDATLIVVDAEPPDADALGPPTDPLTCLGHLVAVWRGEGLAIVHAGGENSAAQSAFADSDLDERLTARGCTTLVVCGFDTDLAVEATVRHAADLGYRIFVVGDACAAKERQDLAGRRWAGEDLHLLALTRMSLVGATVVDLRTAWIAAKSAGWGRK